MLWNLGNVVKPNSMWTEVRMFWSFPNLGIVFTTMRKHNALALLMTRNQKDKLETRVILYHTLIHPLFSAPKPRETAQRLVPEHYC